MGHCPSPVPFPGACQYLIQCVERAGTTQVCDHVSQQLFSFLSFSMNNRVSSSVLTTELEAA